MRLNYEKAYESIVAKVVEAGAICVLTTTPFVDMDTVEVDPSIQRHNAVVRAVTQTTPAHLVDLYAVTKAGHQGGTRTLIQNANGADNWGDQTALFTRLVDKSVCRGVSLTAPITGSMNLKAAGSDSESSSDLMSRVWTRTCSPTIA